MYDEFVCSIQNDYVECAYKLSRENKVLTVLKFLSKYHSWLLIYLWCVMIMQQTRIISMKNKPLKSLDFNAI